MVLPVATVLDQHYEIQRPLDTSPPFSILYLGREIDTGRSVHIQEYFPEFLVQRVEGDVRVRPVDDKKKASLYRTGMDYFRKEAGVLSALSHPNLIEEQAPLSAHGTLYRVRPVRPGMTLAHGVEEKGCLSLKGALTVLKPIAGALETAHQRGLLHGGVTPEAIYLQKRGGPLLHHFRSASIQLARRAGRLDDIVLPGISPIEQYAAEGKQGPWTDVYGLAATMVWVVTGERLPAAPQRAENDDVAERLAAAGAFTEPLRAVLMRALAIHPRERIRSIATFREALQQALQAKPEQPKEPKPEPSAPESNASERVESTKTNDQGAGVEDEKEDEKKPVAPVEKADANQRPEELADEQAAPPAETADPSLEGTQGEQSDPDKEAVSGPPKEKPTREPRASAEDELSKANTEQPSSEEEAPREAESDKETAHPREFEMPRDAAASSRETKEIPDAPEPSDASEPSNESPRTDTQNRKETSTEEDAAEEEKAAKKEAAKKEDTKSSPLGHTPADRTPTDHEPTHHDPVDRGSADERSDDRAPVPSESASAPSQPEATGEHKERHREENVEERAEQERAANAGAIDAGEERSDLAKNRWLVRGALPVVALVLVGALAVWVWPSASGTTESYQAYRTRADSLYAKANYTGAKRLYAKALDARPEDPYVARRLVRIEEMRAAQREEAYVSHLAEGDSLSARADSLLQAKDSGTASDLYRQAKAAYEAALDARPGDSQVATRVESIDSLLRSIEEGAPQSEEALDPGQLFSLYRTQGDEAVEAGNFRVAVRKYEEALEYRPDSTSVRERLQAVRNQIEREQRQARYATIIARADSLFADERYLEAEVQYQQALTLLPEDSLATARIQEVDSLLAEQDRREKQYQYHRGRGDVLFDREDYAEAITSYQRALEFRSGDEYVQNRIAESQQALEAKRRAEQRRREEQKRLAEQKRREAEAQRRERMQENGVYIVADQMPELVGGLAALHEQIEYPRRAADMGIEGRVYLQVVINKDGTVRDASVARGIGGGCDEEALRVVEQATFTPAKVDGEPVPYRHTLWVQFQLEGEQRENDADVDADV